MDSTFIAMGGGVQLDGPVMEEFFRSCGGREAQIVILPTASRLADAGCEYVEALARLGLRSPARVLDVRERADAVRPAVLEAVRSATGIFMTGGNQVRLPVVIGGTPLHQEMLAASRRGAVIGGTSAGTAALSSVMIAFGQSGVTARQHIAQLTMGLGLISCVIFDQHFRQRNRLGRLIYAVASNPGLLGIGVDEDTAAVIECDRLRVTGRGAVTLVDGSEIQDTNVADVSPRLPLAVSGIRLHILTHGCSYDLSGRHSSIPRALSLPGSEPLNLV